MKVRPPDGLIPTVLVVLALAALCVAGFIITLWLGWFMVAVSFGVLGWLRELSERRS